MLGRMPAVDVVDSTWLAARPATVAAIVAQPGNWRRWWPGLDLRVDHWRAEKGVRWTVGEVGRGPATGLSGTAEIWLESVNAGVVAHFFLRLDPPAGRPLPDRAGERIEHHYRLLTKRAFWALADQLDPGRMTRHTSVSHAALG
jgi:hypothetical protein